MSKAHIALSAIKKARHDKHWENISEKKMNGLFNSQIITKKTKVTDIGGHLMTDLSLLKLFKDIL